MSENIAAMEEGRSKKYVRNRTKSMSLDLSIQQNVSIIMVARVQIPSISISVGHFDRRWATLFPCCLASPTLPSRQQLSTAQAGGPPSVEMPRAAIGQFYKATLAFKWRPFFRAYSGYTSAPMIFFDGRIITISWLKLQLKSALFTSATIEIHGDVRYFGGFLGVLFCLCLFFANSFSQSVQLFFLVPIRVHLRFIANTAAANFVKSKQLYKFFE